CPGSDGGVSCFSVDGAGGACAMMPGGGTPAGPRAGVSAGPAGEGAPTTSARLVSTAFRSAQISFAATQSTHATASKLPPSAVLLMGIHPDCAGFTVRGGPPEYIRSTEE